MVAVTSMMQVTSRASHTGCDTWTEVHTVQTKLDIERTSVVHAKYYLPPKNEINFRGSRV